MNKNSIRLERGTVMKVTPAMAAKVWLLKAGQQDTLHAELDAAEELVLGPYLNTVQFRVESEGAITTANQAVDFSTPVPVITAAEDIVEATDETDVADRFNELLVSLRASGVLAGSPPLNTVLPEITGTTETGETLTVDDGTWTGNPTITFTYQWLRNGIAISGATADTHVLVEADEAKMIGCIVTATNDAGSVQAYAVELGPITVPE